jgi:chromosome segregation ATPase
MMLVPEWITDAEKAILEAAKQPTFPGDESLVHKFIDKLVTRLFTECLNGGEFGADECAACRSNRTERAEQSHKRLNEEYIKLADAKSKEAAISASRKVELESVQASLEVAEHANKKLSERVNNAEGSLASREAALRDLQDRYKTLETDTQRVHQAAADASKLVKGLQEKIERYQALAIEMEQI